MPWKESSFPEKSFVTYAPQKDKHSQLPSTEKDTKTCNASFFCLQIYLESFNNLPLMTASSHLPCKLPGLFRWIIETFFFLFFSLCLLTVVLENENSREYVHFKALNHHMNWKEWSPDSYIMNRKIQHTWNQVECSLSSLVNQFKPNSSW